MESSFFNPEDIFVHRYTLRSHAHLNSRSERRGFEGALIRKGDGFGCIHPWPELGDSALDELLKLLASGVVTSLTQQTLICAKTDGEARANGESLFSSISPIPESHFTMPACGHEIPPEFSAVKLKAGRDTQGLCQQLNELPKDLRIRIDFNESLQPQEFLRFWEEVLHEFVDRIEFVEDPVPYNAEDWKLLSRKTNCRFAADRTASDPNTLEAALRVIKPATKAYVPTYHPVVVTSYMDHPVGQLWAAWAASNLIGVSEEMELCGLVTHHLFDDADPFIAGLGSPEPILKPPPGTGLGFDELLEALPWKRLTKIY